MIEYKIQNAMKDALEDGLEACTIGGVLANVRRVRTFADARVLTNNAGLVLTMEDGTEVQVTIAARSR